ncbi:hypothetical protein [Lacticaseibacillus thailandensis]|nr:hypothetical protein [Lacticaseibacillus thailandensis]
MSQLSEEQRALHAQISTAADRAVSQAFTEDQVAARVRDWERGLGHAPTTAELATYLLHEMRGLLEDTLFEFMDQRQH